jgi:hypothetical protein
MSKKFSELTAATAAAGVDTFAIVQGTDSKKLTVASLFADISTPVKFNDKVKIGDENVMTALGTILSTTNINLLSNIYSAGNLGINDGDPGQVKFVIMTSNAGGHTITLQGANLQNDISFSAAGDTATLLYTNSKWYFIGGTATVS